MARFIPDVVVGDIAHDSERVVYEGLRGLPAGFVVLHSFPWLRPTRDLAGEPLREGRDFTEADADPAPLVGIVDEQLARRAWPGQSALGRRFRQTADMPWTTIVGVAGHVRHERLDEDTRPQVYWNYRQRAQDRMALVVKAREEPQPLATSLAAIVRSVDPEQPVYDVRTLDAVVERARQFPGQEQQVWEFYRSNPQALASLRAPIYEEKVVDFLVELAKVTEKKVSKDELYKQDDEDAVTAKAG